MMMSEYYEGGKLHGKQLWYYRSGRIERDYNYFDGEPVDTCFSYNILSGVRYEHIYTDEGKLLKSFHYNSNQLLQSTFAFDSLSGLNTNTYFYESGTIRSFSVWREGPVYIESKSYFENGNIKMEQVYYPNDSTRSHSWKRWTESGELADHRIYKTDGQVEIIVEKNR